MSRPASTGSTGWPYGDLCYCGAKPDYWWLTQPAQNTVPLCERCCTSWRANVTAGDGNPPLRVWSAR